MYDYVPGKADWLARGLPTEGERADEQRVGDLARDDVVTCALDRPVGEMAQAIRDSPHGFALVAASDGTLLGRLRLSKAEEADPAATAEQVMDPGPSTVRPDLSIEELRERLDKRDLRTAVVSTPEGKLIGVVRRKQLG